MKSVSRFLSFPFYCQNFASRRWNTCKGCYVDPKIKRMKKRQEKYQNEANRCPVWLKEGYRDRFLYTITFFLACFGAAFAMVSNISMTWPKSPVVEEDD